MTRIPLSPRGRGVSLVLVGLLCQEGGASVAVLLFPLAGAVGAATLRIGLSALVLVALVRPSLRGHDRAAWTTVLGYGFALAAMNICFYLALTRLDLGTAVTIEVLGPLALSVAVARRWSSVAWALMALAGVALLGAGPHAIDPLGVALALVAAGAWALYIVLAARVAGAFPGLSGLSLGMLVATVIAVPVAAVTTGPALLAPEVLAVGLAVAVLSSALPYAFELVALRYVSASTFSVLVAVAPVNAALAGFLVLGQGLSLTAAAGIALVVVAVAGALRTPVRTVVRAELDLPPRGPSATAATCTALEQDRAGGAAASPPEHALGG